MTYAQAADVEARLDRPVTTADQPRIAALLVDTAAALAARYGTIDLATLVDDHFDLLVSAQARAVARIMSTPVGPVQSSGLDEASVSYYRGYADLLTSAETSALDAALGRTGGGLISVQLTSAYSPPPETA